MKNPDDTIIGGSRKTLPTRKARKVRKESKAGPSKRRARNQTALNEDLVRIFGEK